MVETKIKIKNMVCPRCIRVVREDLEKLGVHVKHVELGEADISFNESTVELTDIKSTLQSAGFELLEDQEKQLIEQVKLEMMKLINSNQKLTVNNSEYLSKKLGVNYGYLSRLFSNQMGVTIEKYVIIQKIEKVKEYLKYENFSSDEIAYKLNYSSVAHLSRQFKEITGMTLSAFKKEHSI